MIMLPSLRIVATAIVLLLLTAELLYAQDALRTARELYASAEYEHALRVLDEIASKTSASEEQQSVEVYRTLCLLAVGRRAEADRVIEAIFARNPLYRPSDELSPRTRTAFIEAKKRLFPTIVQQHYADAKAAFERKDYETAAPAFQRIVDALNDPDVAPSTLTPPLSDLRTLAVGFQELSKRALAPPVPASTPVSAPSAPPSAVAPKPAAPRVFTAEDPGVALPLTLAQELPRYPAMVPPGGLGGVIEVLISEKGTVESATIIAPIRARSPMPGKLVPVSSSYQDTVLAAASRWVYHPARVDGTPVKFRKRVQVNIQPVTP